MSQPRSRPSPSPSFNILPINDPLLSDHPTLRFPEVRSALSALSSPIPALPQPPHFSHQWPPPPPFDIFDYLSFFFSFQPSNCRNQREHLLLLLSNSQMRLSPAPSTVHDALDPSVPRRLRKKLLKNYTSWCAFLRLRPNFHIPEQASASTIHYDLLFSALFLLVWGEAANLRFVPECLCYIYHNVARELHYIIEERMDPSTGRLALPASYARSGGEFSFLNTVVSPFYDILSKEANASNNGTAPHTNWRNYDDINEYFWKADVFERISWPPDRSKAFFLEPPNRAVGKTGFVEQRTFWNIYRSFDRLWVLLILFLQAAAIVAWQTESWPWIGLKQRETQVRVLSVVITWAGLRLLQSLLDAVTQFPLISRETKLTTIRMVLKTIAAGAWTAIFVILYLRIWDQKNRDKNWSPAANRRIITFLEAAAVFVIPEALGVALFIIPWLRSFLEKTNWRLFSLLTWWFQSRMFVGRGLQEGLVDNVKYSIFWILLLAVKFTFSYAMQIRPLVKPTKEIAKITNIHYYWHQFYSNSNRFAIFLLWLPVVTIYLMDIQIWYAIFSSLTGALVGLFEHIGEIRDIKQLRLRFQFFASAMSFNIIPEEQLLTERTFGSRWRNFVGALKLRYGFGRPYRKFEHNHVETQRFSLIWNEIILKFRDEDIINDHEVELLELPPDVWNIRVVRWPCFLLCNELQLAIDQAKEIKSQDHKLWKKISKHEYRRCAVIEVYDSVRHLLLAIIKEQTEDHSIVKQLFKDFDECMEIGKFTEEYKMSVLSRIHAKLSALLDILIKPNKEPTKVVTAFQGLYEAAVRDFRAEKKSVEQLKQEGLAQAQPQAGNLLFENSLDLPNEDNVTFYRQVRRLHTILTSKDSMNNIPRNLEAQRRLAFFSNSLFMNIPRAPHVEKMLSFSVLTPYYSEEVLFSKEQLRNENEDGISIIYYLQKIYADEWDNFLERMRKDGMVKEEELWGERLFHLRLWASYRGQTLARTVRGMMYYYDALKMLTFLDSASEVDLMAGSKELVSVGSSRREIDGSRLAEDARSLSSRSLNRENSGVRTLFKGHEYGTALMKYTYVVACQIYGSQKAKKDPRAEEIFYLLRNNEALRVAYVDEVTPQEGQKEYYSVLVKYDQKLAKEVEIYRVKLPGPMKLGEGKPENQNHAIIFTRGDAVQTIDMNQDNYFEEALKMRNLLEEYSRKYGIRKPHILGIREHVFTGSVSSLAKFMSAQETSFVTLGQRVLANPLKVRMHYGHPDLFDRLWFLSRGGISKASRVINISEDIFAGFNCTLRGGNVTHHEYIQVGKGRDVGLNQISMFEAKVSSGNGEQTLSRDVYRLGHRLDFFRMLSFFYTTIGFYFNTLMLVLTVYAFVWGRFYLALSGLEDAIKSSSDSNKALATALNQQFLIQLGLFTALPMIVENSLELGFLAAIWDFVKMQLQLASVFYTFSMGTKAHYYGRTILHGGAKYRATGRGFVVEHKKFAENYRLYARSHFVKAIELGVMLTVYASFSGGSNNTLVYILLTISSWFLVSSWILAPFLFNPSGLDWLKNYEDFGDFLNWISFRSGISVKPEQSWEKWWEEETDHLRNTGFLGKIMEIILDLRFFFFQYGIVYRLNIANESTSILVYLLSWICIFVAFVLFILLSYIREEYSAKKHIWYRLAQAIIVFLVVATIVVLLEFTHFQFVDIFTCLLAFLPTGWGLISIALVFKSFLQKFSVVWEAVVAVARFYDLLLGVIVIAPVAVLSWLPGFQEMQTRILFNDAFSRGLQITRILTGKKVHIG